MEARAATSAPKTQAWALFFPRWAVEPGEDLRLPVGEEVKIVWRVTGASDAIDIRAVGPSGAEVPPLWGPNRQGSNWERPGDERGTGWLLPESGCWTFEVRRDDATHILTAVVEEIELKAR